MTLTALGWQRVFAQLAQLTPTVHVVAFDVDEVDITNMKIALVLSVDGWARPVRRRGSSLALTMFRAKTEADVVATLRRQLGDIKDRP